MEVSVTEFLYRFRQSGEEPSFFFFSRLARKRRKSIVDFGSDVIKLDAIEVSNYYICAFFLRNEREKKKKGKSIWYSSEFAAFYIYTYIWAGPWWSLLRDAFWLRRQSHQGDAGRRHAWRMNKVGSSRIEKVYKRKENGRGGTLLGIMRHG